MEFLDFVLCRNMDRYILEVLELPGWSDFLQQVALSGREKEFLEAICEWFGYPEEASLRFFTGGAYEHLIDFFGEHRVMESFGLQLEEAPPVKGPADLSQQDPDFSQLEELAGRFNYTSSSTGGQDPREEKVIYTFSWYPEAVFDVSGNSLSSLTASIMEDSIVTVSCKNPHPVMKKHLVYIIHLGRPVCPQGIEFEVSNGKMKIKLDGPGKKILLF